MKTLLLAGTQEARALADLLANHGVEVVASLAGVTDRPTPLGVPTRVGGFGGKAAQKTFIETQGIRAVIDATHPFARQISQRSLTIARELGLPYLRLLRREWRAKDGDDWKIVPQERAVSELIPAGARVLLATGAQSVGTWSDLAVGRTLFCRRIDPPVTPFPFDGDWVVGRPPFTVDDEVGMMKRLSIEWVVTKNSGGPTRAKLDAARLLGLPVVMVARPTRMVCDHATTPTEALAWLMNQNG